MSDAPIPDSQPGAEAGESFDQILSQFEQSHSRPSDNGGRQLEGTVIVVSRESVFLDIGYKSEGILPLAEFESAGEKVKPGDRMMVSVKGRDPEGYYELSRSKIERPRDWPALERLFAEKATVAGTVIGVVKGGLSVDVGVRAFLPASRSGARSPEEMEKLVGQEIRVRITKLDVGEEDVVVDRRAVAEEEERRTKERRASEIQEGEVLSGTIRSLTDYGAFVDLGGIDALLHVGDIAWSRVAKPADVLSLGQQVEVKVLKTAAEHEKRRISVGMKQLQPHPWDLAEENYKPGDRVRGTVTRVAEFGAFVEVASGIEGLIHVSEMSWTTKVRKASDLLAPGEMVETVVLSVNAGDRRMSLGLKQALGDPWREAAQKFPAGSVVEAEVISFTKFGAFVRLSDGLEGMIHVSDLSAEKHISHPQEVLRLGQPVKTQVLVLDAQKRQLRLGIKQLRPNNLDEYLAEHKEGDAVSGRIVEVSGPDLQVELGEGIHGGCRVAAPGAPPENQRSESGPDLLSLTSMLEARWKGRAAAGGRGAPDALRPGQVRNFRIARLDRVGKKIELELAQ